MDANTRQLVDEARGVLDKNWTGRYTKPSPLLYPHQWSWDSGFIAIGYSTYDQEKAQRELESLFEAQWKNGMVPHIVFDPDVEDSYFPDAPFWQAGLSENGPDNQLTSGITQPPVHAIASLLIYKRATDKPSAKAFLERLYPQLLRSHQFFYGERDPGNEGLAYIRHPWESGIDNSPTWDVPLKKMELKNIARYERQDLEKGIPPTQRPTDEDYDRYIYLVELFKKERYDEARILANSPFLVQDTLVNSILIKANNDLAEIATIVGEDPDPLGQWEQQTAEAMNRKLWHSKHKFYDDYDLRSGSMIEVDTAAGFCPLFAGVTRERAQNLYNYLDSNSFCAMHENTCFSVPNYNMEGEHFDPGNYWRGPVWININWMLYHGLRRNGFTEKSESVKNDIVELVKRFGFYEYYDPIEGKGYGSRNFSWSAALFLDTVFTDGEDHA